MKLSTILLVAALSLTTFTAEAQMYDQGIDDAPSASAMAFDLLLIRPLSLVATVVGTGLFIVAAPLSLIMGEAPTVPAKVLVEQPAAFTFTRPLGQMN
ncbi:MAG: hypothetical protein ACRESS_12125 [Stenotrophobium sp.]